MKDEDIPEGLRDAARRFLTAVSLVELDADGLPCNPNQAAEVDVLTGLANELVAGLSGTLPNRSEVARQVWRLADDWQCVMAATNRGRSHSKAMGSRWLAARAQAPDLLPAEPVAVVRLSDDIMEPIDSPRVQAMVAADPDLAGFIAQANAAAADS